MKDSKHDTHPALILRPAVPADAKQISRLSIHLGYGPANATDTKQQLTALLESDREAVYVAEQKGVLVGWLHCFKALRLASASFYEIGGLVVCPKQRQQGIGKQLVEYAVAQHPGTWRVRCNSKRHESHLFYQALGFSLSKSQHIFEYHTDS